MKLCLAASGGGHLRQILEMKGLYHRNDVFFVSEDSILLRSFDGPQKRLSVTPFALGLARKNGVFDLLRRVAKNFLESYRHIRAERPDVVITTGAGSVFFTAVLARLFGARLIVIETLARSSRLSKFAQIAGRIAHQRVLQNPALSPHWPSAPVFDPLKALQPKQIVKKDLILVTVGATLPFDRMVMAVAELEAQGRLSDKVVYQVGEQGARPVTSGEIHEELPIGVLRSTLQHAKIVICHGGTGSIITALEAGCHVIAFARQHALGEHVDDHQQDITAAFEARGLIQLAWDAESLARAIERTATRTVTPVTSDMTELCIFLQELTDEWFQAPAPRQQPADDRSSSR